MAGYVKTQWNTTTVFNPTNMNHIEQGIYDASNMIKKVSYTGTTNANGTISGSMSSFGLPSNAYVLSAYFERDSYSAVRYVELGQYGTGGVYFKFYDNGTPVANSSVKLSIIYVAID